MTGVSLVPVIVMVNVLNVDLDVRREIVVDLRHVGQCQRLAGGEEIEGAVGDAVGPGCRAVVDVGGVLHHDERHFDRLDRGDLLCRQRRRDFGVLGILIGERVEDRLGRRLIAGVDVGVLDRGRSSYRA